MSTAAQRAKRREEVDYVYGEVAKAATYVSLCNLIPSLRYGFICTIAHSRLTSTILFHSGSCEIWLVWRFAGDVGPFHLAYVPVSFILRSTNA